MGISDPGNLRDRKILSALRNLSNIFYEKAKSKRFGEKVLEFDDQALRKYRKEIEVGTRYAGIDLQGFTIKRIQISPKFHISLLHKIAMESRYYTPPSSLEDRASDVSGWETAFVIYIFDGAKDSEKYSFIYLFANAPTDKKTRMGRGWYKKQRRGDDYDDYRIFPHTPLQIHYSLEGLPSSPHASIRPISIFIQSAVFLAQERFLSTKDCLINDFKEYVFSTFTESELGDGIKELQAPRHEKKKTLPESYRGYSTNDLLKMLDLFYENKIRAEWSRDNIEAMKSFAKEYQLGEIANGPAKSRGRRWRINLQEIDDNILPEALVKIIKDYNQPRNPTSFEVFARKTIAGILKTKKGLPRKYTYQRKTPIEKTKMRADYISIISQKRGINKDSARRQLSRLLKKKSLSQIWLELKR